MEFLHNLYRVKSLGLKYLLSLKPYTPPFNKTFTNTAKVTKQIRVELIHTLNPLSANFTKWSDKLKQFVGNLPTNCLSVFDHFVGLALRGLRTRFYYLHDAEACSMPIKRKIKISTCVSQKHGFLRP